MNIKETSYKLQQEIRDYLYDNSILRNTFQIRPVAAGEIKVLKNVQYAHVFDKIGVITYNNCYAYLTLTEVTVAGCSYRSGYNKVKTSLCKKMLKEETSIYEKLTDFITEETQNILYIRLDVEIVPTYFDNRKLRGFFAVEQIGAVVLNKNK
jgi:hypothetical protein